MRKNRLKNSMDNLPAMNGDQSFARFSLRLLNFRQQAKHRRCRRQATDRPIKEMELLDHKGATHVILKL